MKKLLAILLALVMVLTLAACGEDKEEGGKPDNNPDQQTRDTTPQDTDVDTPAGTTLQTPLWTLVYDEADGWVNQEDNFDDSDTYSRAILIIPGAEEGEELINIEIRVSIDDPYSFRDYLVSYGFDQYEYAVNNAYDFIDVGGVDCLMQEGNYWGEPCLRYFNRVEGAGATVFIEIIGEYEDERVDELLSGLTISLTDVGNVDGPWYWNGEPFAADDASVLVGTHTLDVQWVPFAESVVTDETFEHAVAVVGDNAYILSEGVLKQYAFDGSTLTFAADIALDSEYDSVYAATDGTLWLSNFIEPLTGWKDGALTASFEGPDYVAMHPSGSWGVSWFSSNECELVDLSGGGYTTTPITFAEVDTIMHLMVDEDNIYVCGSAVDDSGHKVFIYDKDGTLKLTLANADGSGMGSITFIAQTGNGFIALDGNMREVKLWTADGTYIGEADDGDLFGTSYPWFCGAVKLADGSILAIMTEDRADESAMELIAFRISGF